MKRALIATIFSVMMVSTAVSQQICPYTGRPYYPQTPAPQQTIYTQPVSFDNQKMIQQQIQRANLQAQQNLQRDQLAIQHRIQMTQLEFNFKQPASPTDAQMFQQQITQLQQEIQTINQRYQEETRRIQAMR